MSYHHLALAARDMKAIHRFYEELMGFELVKVEIGEVRGGGWAKHFFYRMESNDAFIAFWELHDVPLAGEIETNLSKAAGLPDYINHVAFGVESPADRARALAALTADDLEMSAPPAAVDFHHPAAG